MVQGEGRRLCGGVATSDGKIGNPELSSVAKLAKLAHENAYFLTFRREARLSARRIWQEGCRRQKCQFRVLSLNLNTTP
jgi:hypothetical protein